MNKEYATGEGALAFQHVSEEQVVIIFQSHATENDDVHFSLKGNASQKVVVGLTGDGKDGEFLRLHQGIEHVNHGNACAHDVTRNNAFGGVHRRSSDR